MLPLEKESLFATTKLVIVCKEVSLFSTTKHVSVYGGFSICDNKTCFCLQRVLYLRQQNMFLFATGSLFLTIKHISVRGRNILVLQQNNLMFVNDFPSVNSN